MTSRFRRGGRTNHLVTDVTYLNKEGCTHETPTGEDLFDIYGLDRDGDGAGWQLIYVSRGFRTDWLLWKRQVEVVEDE